MNFSLSLSFHLSVCKSVINAFQHSTKFFSPSPHANHALKSEIVSFCCRHSIIQMDLIHIQRMHQTTTEYRIHWHLDSKDFKFLAYCICYQIPNKNQIALDMRHHRNDKMFSTGFFSPESDDPRMSLNYADAFNFVKFHAVFFFECLMFFRAVRQRAGECFCWIKCTVC